MAFPVTKTSFDRPVNAVWNPALNAGLGGWEGGTDPTAQEMGGVMQVLEDLQDVVGYTGSDPLGGSHEARLNRMEGASGSVISVGPTDPAGPTTYTLEVRTDAAPWRFRGWDGAAWNLIGADAVSLLGLPLEAVDPTDDGMVPTWDVGTAQIRWRAQAATGAMANPMTDEWDVIRGGAVSGGHAAPTRFPLDPTVGKVLGVIAGPALGYITPPWVVQPVIAVDDILIAHDTLTFDALTRGPAGSYLGVTSDNSLEYIVPPFMPKPAGVQQGDLFMVDNTLTVVRLPPDPVAGRVLTNSGLSAQPVWADITASPAGGAIAAPLGPVAGDLLQNNGTDWVAGPHGTSSAQFLHWNQAASRWEAAVPPTGMVSPLAHTGATLYSADGSGTPAERLIGSSLDVYTVVGGVPVWQSLGGKLIPTFFDWTYQGSAPATPAALTGRTYWKTDGKFYGKNAAGTEYDLTVTPAAGSKHVYQDEGAPVTVRSKANFVGAGVTLSDDAGNDATVITVPAYYVIVEEEGTPLTARSKLNFVGASVTAADDAGNDATVVTIAGGGYALVQDEGTPLTARPTLNFVGAGVAATDDSGNAATVVTIPSWYNRLQVAGGTLATQRSRTNFIGSMPVTLTDNSGNDSTDVAIGPDYATAFWMGD
jgi:hypothetical protein